MVELGWEERSVAIDGLAGTGKSTLARRLGEKIGLVHLDTGATYRAVGLVAIHEGIDFADETAILSALEKHRFDYVGSRMFLAGLDISDEIRHPAISDAASQVAVLPMLRALLVAWQRDFVQAHGGAVVEGRDIGTVVLPKARLKVYLKADEEIRLKRRGDTPSMEVSQRDHRDSTRQVNPLRKAVGAIEMDTTDRNISELIGEMEGLYYLTLPE